MAEALNRTEREFLLNCGICGGRLTDPRILDCLHSFCKECLVIKQEQATKKDVVICELCGTHTCLSNDSIDSLTTNIFVMNIGRVEEITNSNCSFYCTFCEDQGDWEEASSRCLTCGDWLCLACAGRHCGTTVTKRHKVVTLDDVRVDPQHRPELRKLYESFLTMKNYENFVQSAKHLYVLNANIPTTKNIHLYLWKMLLKRYRTICLMHLKCTKL